jgi:hypothetical protein
MPPVAVGDQKAVDACELVRLGRLSVVLLARSPNVGYLALAKVSDTNLNPGLDLKSDQLSDPERSKHIITFRGHGGEGSTLLPTH